MSTFAFAAEVGIMEAMLNKNIDEMLDIYSNISTEFNKDI
jgi:hypothetical protein